MISEDLFKIDVNVFSSHKTMTQTLINTFRSNGIKARHCHLTQDIGIEHGEYNEYIERYFHFNENKLKVVSVFRDPLDRMVSSFFQSLSRDVYGRTENERKELVDIKESVLFTESMDRIIDRFCTYSETIDGFGESLHIICNELNMKINEFFFDETIGFGHNPHQWCDIYFFRFDILKDNIPSYIKKILNVYVNVKMANISKEKWYFNHYKEFSENLKIPRNIIENIYYRRQDIMNVFYKNQIDSIVEEKVARYGI